MPETKDCKPLDRSMIRQMQDLGLDVTNAAWRDVLQTLNDTKFRADPAATVLSELADYTRRRENAVLFIASNELPWDAEIVLRSYYEGFIRLVRLSNPDRVTRERYVSEFLGPHRRARARRRANNAALAEAASRSFEDEGASTVYRHLQNPDWYEMAGENKAARTSVERKWSFSEIVRSLDSGPNSLVGFTALLQMYGQQSHLLHADSAALDLMYDRTQRFTGERALLEQAHVTRIHLTLPPEMPPRMS